MSHAPPTAVTIVIPVLNEAESLPQLADEIKAVAQQEEWGLQVVMVDDGSTDDTWTVIGRLAYQDARFQGIRFRRNFGKAAALAAGFAQARGEIVVTLDGDLQDDPAEVPKLLARLAEGCDTVSGWKRTRRDPWHKVWPSRIFNLLVAWLTGVRLHDVNCGLKAYRREAVEEVALYGELHRFIPVLAHAKGFRPGEVEVNHRPRRHGRSKFGARRFLRGLLDLLTVKFLTGYGTRPLHLFGGLGLASFGVGMAGVTYLAILWLMGRGPIGERPLLSYSVMAVLLGAQLLALGFLGELLIAYHIRRDPPYSIREVAPRRFEASERGAPPPV
ncbi:MAG: glycosyltransferase family 2 protein [Armatimonadetes bacterium]|nr:glycosyltransferase family 2 protein [Armatimonadota bacterium]